MIRRVTALLLLPLAMAAPLRAEDRVALVMGNSQYHELPDSRQLSSPPLDARDVAEALAAMGYTIVTGGAVTDAGKEAFVTATEKFAAQARGASSAVFYYSGHGVQVGEDQYLLPSDTPKLSGMSVLKNRAVLLRDSVMVALEEAGVKNKIIILDCCRDNPFSAALNAALSAVGKSVQTKGVGEMTGYGPGFYLAFATSPGFTALDGDGQRNSPFTAALLKSLPSAAGQDIDFLFREVKEILGDAQVSWTSHSLRESLVFAPGKGAPPMGEAEIQRRVSQEVARLKSMPEATALTVPDSRPLQAGTPVELKLPQGEKMTFCFCPPGSFLMGDPGNRVQEDGQAQVRISKGFWMAQTECTQGQWEALMGTNPGHFRSGRELPVEMVSWEEAQAFMAKLNASVPLPKGLIFALPTEAQWEYACRAGTTGPFATGDMLTTGSANFDGRLEGSNGTSGVFLQKTAAVRSYAANPWGLYDMHGNVHEWCRDAMNYLPLTGGTDPVTTAGTARVTRGGAWSTSVELCRSSARASEFPNVHSFSLGLRAALIPQPKP